MDFSTGAFAVPDSDDDREEHEDLSADGLLLLPYIAYVQVRKNRL